MVAWHFVTFQHVFHHASKVVLCDRRNTFARFSADEWHFSWQGLHFGDRHRHYAWQAQHFRRVFANGIGARNFVSSQVTEASHKTSILR